MSVSKMRSSPLRYGAVTQLFHWLTVALVGTAYLVSPGGSEQRVYSAAFDTARQTHETIGIVLFGLVLMRILWRLYEPTPEPPPMAPWIKSRRASRGCISMSASPTSGNSPMRWAKLWPVRGSRRRT